MKQTEFARRITRHIRGTIFLCLVLILLGACSSSKLQVRSDIDPGTNFSQFRTFNFFDPMGVEGGYNSPIFGELFREAITREMRQRGYRLADSPDLMLNVTMRSDDRVKMTSYTAPYMSGAYYSRPGGPYYGSALGVGVGVSQRATKVTEASIFIDIVDPRVQRVVWQGVAVADVDDKVAQQLRNAIFTAVNETFKLYPQQAGQ